MKARTIVACVCALFMACSAWAVDTPVYGTQNAFQNNVTVGSTTAGKNLTVYGTGTFTFATGVDVVIGRGTTDTDITYIALRSANGTKFYIYPDDSGALITSTTAP